MHDPRGTWIMGKCAPAHQLHPQPWAQPWPPRVCDLYHPVGTTVATPHAQPVPSRMRDVYHCAGTSRARPSGGGGASAEASLAPYSSVACASLAPRMRLTWRHSCALLASCMRLTCASLSPHLRLSRALGANCPCACCYAPHLRLTCAGGGASALASLVLHLRLSRDFGASCTTRGGLDKVHSRTTPNPKPYTLNPKSSLRPLG